ncbi:hypothetical protein HPC49_31690 [Pyxidicoccus fallax]|uniref:Lipoprotein n=1 Tax=Pyxidicoccus fallax TaxID=394095 RepID=A0A848LU06_9BACT|nr:hypothetical protein [Pyxidicoccus fallax]NMO21488.1 hypothetical protein [Pyxidicoccus fallax]NPC82773.1 hypothetical protein [Pyxidicoccus fallax]
MKRFPLRELLHVAAMSGIVFAAVHCGGEAPANIPEGDVHFDDKSALLTTNRDALRLCVREAPGLRGGGRVTERLDASLKALDAHPDWAAARFGAKTPTVEAGCPGPALPLARIEPKESIVGPGPTTKPGRFRTFIHVLDEKTADVVLGERKAERAVAEFLRVDDHILAEVTTALVVRESYLDDPEFASRWLSQAVGLQPMSAGFQRLEDGEVPGVLGDFVEKPVTDTSALRGGVK